VCLIVGWGGGSAFADGSRDKSTVDSELQLAKASDAQVEAEANRLAQVTAAERGKLADAQQAEAAAKQAAQDATQKLAEVTAREVAAKTLLARSAVDAYVDPRGQGTMVLFSGASTFEEAARRSAFVSVIQGDTTDALQTLRGVKQDRAAAQKNLEAASELAAQRTTEEAARLKAAQAAQAQQDAAHAELQKRISDLQSESAALAAADAGVKALLAPSQSFQDAPPVVAASSASGMIWPVRGIVTSEFGSRWGSFHPGIDIAAPEGTPIAAAKSGVVVFAGWNDGGYGNFVVLDNGGGVGTAYAHQSRIAVSEGQHVSQGQTLGYVGTTGNSTGDHLHFEVRINGQVQNPRSYLP
jgi:murein DD-endopeptidase MepM/ murein hydrolase activator NlpD